MNRILVFILGFLAGIVFVILASYAFICCHEQETQPQYFTVDYKNSDIPLHTYMPQDSVRILMGEPSDKELITIGGDVVETWKYQVGNRYETVDLTFKEGKLRAVQK